MVFNGAPLEEFKRPGADARRAEREGRGFGSDDLVIGTVGRLDHQKGNDILPSGRGPRAPASAENPLRRGGRRSPAGGTPGRSTGAGHREPHHLHRVLPRRARAPGGVRPAGLPFALGRHTAHRVRGDGHGPADRLHHRGRLGRVLRHRENALQVPPRDPEALAAGILELVDDAALARTLGLRPKRTAGDSTSAPPCGRWRRSIGSWWARVRDRRRRPAGAVRGKLEPKRQYAPRSDARPDPRIRLGRRGPIPVGPGVARGTALRVRCAGSPVSVLAGRAGPGLRPGGRARPGRDGRPARTESTDSAGFLSPPDLGGLPAWIAICEPSARCWPGCMGRSPR